MELIGLGCAGLAFAGFLIFMVAVLVKSYYDPGRFVLTLGQLCKRHPLQVCLLLISLLVTALIRFLLSASAASFLLLIPLILGVLAVPKARLRVTRRNAMLTSLTIVLAATIYIIFIKMPIVFFFVLSVFPLSGTLLILLAYCLLLPLEVAVGRSYMRKARQKIAGCPNLRIIGITGSYGKTTFKSFLIDLLGPRRVLASPGNVNTPMGLTRFINERLSSYDEFLIVEMGIDRRRGMKKFSRLLTLDYAVITAVGPQHLKTFHSLANIYEAKTDIAKLLKSDGVIVYGADTVPYSSKFSGHRSIAFQKSDYRLINGKDGVTSLQSPTAILQTKLASSGAVLDAYGAFLLARDLGAGILELQMRFLYLKEPKRRKEIRHVGGQIVIDDSYNINLVTATESSELALSYPGVRAVVTAGLFEDGRTEAEEEFAKLLTSFDSVVLTGFHRPRRLIRAYLKAGGSPSRLFVVDSLSAAYRKVATADVVLLLPTGEATSLS